MMRKACYISFFAFVLCSFLVACTPGAKPGTSSPVQDNIPVNHPASEGQPTVDEATPTSSVPPVEVLYSNGYTDASGYYHVVGEVKNTSDYRVDSVTLHIRMLDQNGNVLQNKFDSPAESKYCQVFMNRLDPGEVSAFDYDTMLDEGVTPASLDVQFIKADTLVYNDYVSGINVEKKFSYIERFSWTEITGELVNTNNFWVWINYGEGVVRDTSGEVVGAASLITGTYLAPAGDPSGLDRAPFIVSIHGPITDAVSQDINFHAYQAKETPPPLSYEVNQPNFYLDGLGYAHLHMMIENTGSENIYPSLQAAIFDTTGNVISISVQDFPTYSCLEPGKKLPIDFSNWMVSANNFDMSAVAKNSVRVENVFSTTDFKCFKTNYLDENAAKDIATNFTGHGAVDVTGKLTNTSSESLDTIMATVYYTDPTGKIVGLESDLLYPPNGEFAPGEEVEFEMTLRMSPSLDMSTITQHVLLVGQKP
jgi:hypothetical protein